MSNASVAMLSLLAFFAAITFWGLRAGIDEPCQQPKRRLRCTARTVDGQWQVTCRELGLAARAASLEAAQGKLHAQIVEHVHGAEKEVELEYWVTV